MQTSEGNSNKQHHRILHKQQLQQPVRATGITLHSCTYSKTKWLGKLLRIDLLLPCQVKKLKVLSQSYFWEEITYATPTHTHTHRLCSHHKNIYRQLCAKTPFNRKLLLHKYPKTFVCVKPTSKPLDVACLCSLNANIDKRNFMGWLRQCRRRVAVAVVEQLARCG